MEVDHTTIHSLLGGKTQRYLYWHYNSVSSRIEIPPISDAAKFHISRAFFQAYQWVYAYIPVRGILNNDLLYEGFTQDSEKTF